MATGSGSITPVLPITITAAAMTTSAVGSVTPPVVTVLASGKQSAFGNVVLAGAPTVSGTGVRGTTTTGVVATPLPTVDAGAQTKIEIDAPTIESTGVRGLVGIGAVTPPVSTIVSTGLTGRGSVGVIQTPVTTIDGGTGIGAVVQSPVPTISAVQKTGRAGTGAIFTAEPVVDASHFTTNANITGSVTAPAPAVASSLTHTKVITGSVTGVAANVQTNGVSGNTASASISVPVVTLSATGGSSAIGTATVSILAPIVEASGISTLVAPVFTGFVVNTRNAAATELSGLTFNSMTTFAGLQLAATDTGVVALTTDTTDEGTAITASAASGLSDFQSTGMKRVIAAYVSCRAAGVMTLTLITDEKTEREYRFVPRETGLHPAKVIFGQGVQGRNWQWKLNNEGYHFNISEMTLEVATLSRRRI